MSLVPTFMTLLQFFLDIVFQFLLILKTQLLDLNNIPMQILIT